MEWKMMKSPRDNSREEEKKTEEEFNVTCVYNIKNRIGLLFDSYLTRFKLF